MASTRFLFYFFIFLYAAAGHSSPIKEACRATRSPESCQLSLTNSGLLQPQSNPFQILRSALTLSSKNVGKAKLMVRDILRHSAGNRNLSTVAETCLEALGYSAYRLRLTEEVLPRGRSMKDARAWTSAALSYQFDCLSGLKKVNTTTHTVTETLSFGNNTLMTSTSNVLSMMMSYEAFGNDTVWWGPPRTEREGYWERVGGGSGSGPEPGVPLGLKADVSVCKGGGCTYERVQMAVDAAPENLRGGRRFVIWIKEGVYEEIVRVPLGKRNLVLLGDGMGKTVITGSLNVGHLGMTTYNTATVGVVGDGFMARDLTIQNTAGADADAHQAVAFRSDSDLSVLENCEFIGHQDTLYAHSLRQLFKSCTIHGTVDFIFGNAAAVFHNCTIHGTTVIAAQGRMDPAQTTGFVFRRCAVDGGGRMFLGRPWKEFSRVVFVECELGANVSALGWMPWEGDFALKTLYFGEYGNWGSGADLSTRVAWSSRAPADRIEAYSVRNFIQGDQWKLTYSG